MCGLGYTYQTNPPLVLIGTKAATTRTSVALTTAYDIANKTKAFNTAGMSKINFSLLYTTGASETATSLKIRISTSGDNTNWYQIVNESVSGATSTLTAREFSYAGGAGATAYAFSLPLDLQETNMQISVKEAGVVTNAGTIFVEATVSGGE